MALETLRNDDYEDWSVCVRNYLIANDLWDDIIEPTTTDDPKLEDDDLKAAWRRKNAAALLAIHISCDRSVLSKIRKIDSAKIAWHELAKINLTHLDGGGGGASSGVNEGVNITNIDITPSLEVDCMEISQPEGVNSEIEERNPSLPQSPQEQRRAIHEKSYAGVSEGNTSPGIITESKSGNSSLPLSSEDNASPSRFGEIPDEDDGYARFIPLVHAIAKGDLNHVKSFIELHPEAKTAKIIPSNGSRALHVACYAEQLKIVKELVARLSVEDLELEDNGGCTALAVVAQNPALINIAECLLKKNKELIKIGDSQEFLPVVSAAQRHHKDMTRYLYSVTRDQNVALDDKNGIMLFISCIKGNILDVALDVIKNNTGFTTTENHTGISSPIRALSKMIYIFPSGSKLPFWKRMIYSCIQVSLPDYSNELRVTIPPCDEESEERTIIRQVLDYILRLGSTLPGISGMKKLYEMKLMHRQALEILRCMSEQISIIELPVLNEVTASIFLAVQFGTVEFVMEMVKFYPLLLYVRDRKGNGIFQYAVRYRQEKIFSLLYGLDAINELLITSEDPQNPTLTHFAGLLAPSSQLARISGAPLQMQRELQWYQEVKSAVGSIHEFSLNEERKTPYEAFTKNHKQLVKEGEEWMKQAASSCTVVGALIITVMFTAAFTVPGGNDQNTGYPMFLHKKLFTVFIITDAISLFFSSTSVLMFLAILTSRYAAEDFLKSLPTKLTIGLSTLFISIASMMVAFCAAVILMLKGELRIVVPLALLACIPIALFIKLQFPLLLEIFMSTYGPSIFDRKMKRWCIF